MPFFPVWLKAKGLDAATIGLVLAVPMVVRVVAIPFAARAADRRDALRGTIVLRLRVSVAGFALLGFADGVAGDLVGLRARLAGAHAGHAADRHLCA